jgi:hypothetical protein
MPVILWSVLAVVLVILTVFAASLYGRIVSPPIPLPVGEELPPTRLQRAVSWSLALSVPMVAVAGGLVGWFGPVAYSDDDTVRLTVTVLLIIGLITLAAPTILAGAWARAGDTTLDERDRAILGRASAGQAAAILIVLAVWAVALTETFHGQPGVPTEFLYLIVWSCLLVTPLASNVAILIGYRWS